MIEIFTTSIENKAQVRDIHKIFEIDYPKLKIDFDLEDIQTTHPFGQSIMRVEGTIISPENIIVIINNQGFECEILEDKISNQ